MFKNLYFLGEFGYNKEKVLEINMKVDMVYDVLIVGGGVAGMSAAIYAKRAGKTVAIIEKFALGGQVLQLEKIENFPSQTSVDGVSLARMFKKQIKDLQVEVIFDEIEKIDFGKPHKLQGKSGRYLAEKVIVATGISYVTLGIGEEAFLGRGVSYCAVCDGNFYKGQTVAVASRAGSGIKDALYLAKLAKEVILLDEEDMAVYAGANKTPNLKVISNCKVKKVLGNEKVFALDVQIGKELQTLEIDALFVLVGKKVDASLFGEALELDGKGYVQTDQLMRTSVEGVFAVGDVRNGALKQIVTACSDGAIAGNGC